MRVYIPARAKAGQRAGLGTQSWEANEGPSTTVEDTVTKGNQARRAHSGW